MTGGWGNERYDYTFGVGGGNYYARFLHGFLIAANEKAQLQPGIASVWGMSADGKTFTFTIRGGGKFHDGTEVTANDVLWSLRHTIGPQANDYAPTPQSLPRIMERIEQTAPDRVSLTTKVPAPDFPATISEAGSGWYGVYPKRATLHDLNEEAAYDGNPIGAGPMKLVRHVPGAVMTFERFEDYYYQPKNGLPEDRSVRFRSLDLRRVPEEATRVAAMRAGEADIAPVSLLARKQVEAGGGRLVFGQEGVYFNIKQLGCWKLQFPCHDKRVRQALNYAIYKELMRDRLYGGPVVMQVKGWTGVTPSTIGYSPNLDPFPFDPVKARQLLAEAGYPGGKGFGKLVINTWVSTSLPFMPESAQLAADNWRRELGLDLEVKVWDEAALTKASTLTADLYGQILWRDYQTRVDAASTLQASYGFLDAPGRVHNDPELFALVNATLAVIDPVAREGSFNQLYRRLRDESYELGIGYLNISWAVGPRISAWQPWPLAFYPTNLHGIILK